MHLHGSCCVRPVGSFCHDLNNDDVTKILNFGCYMCRSCTLAMRHAVVVEDSGLILTTWASLNGNILLRFCDLK